MGPVRQNPILRTVSLFICVCIALCTIVAHNIAQNRPDRTDLTLQTITTTPMMSIWGKGGKCPSCHPTKCVEALTPTSGLASSWFTYHWTNSHIDESGSVYTVSPMPVPHTTTSMIKSLVAKPNGQGWQSLIHFLCPTGKNYCSSYHFSTSKLTFFHFILNISR